MKKMQDKAVTRSLIFPSNSSFQPLLKSAFLSSVCLAFVRQRSSGEQWQKEDFLSLSGLVSDLGTEDSPGVGLGSCFGYPVGLEIVGVERMERWFFFGFLLCHYVIDVTKKEAGEYRIWSLLLQGMWVLPIFR